MHLGPRLDIDNDANNDGAITLEDEEHEPRHELGFIQPDLPGQYIEPNIDDDNQNDLPDYDELNAVEGEDDLVAFQIAWAVGSVHSTFNNFQGWELVLSSDGRVWSGDDKTGPIVTENAPASANLWIIGQDEIPSTLYFESRGGDSLVTLSLRYPDQITTEFEKVAYDSILFTADYAPSNNPPTTNDDFYGVNENGELSAEADTGLLANDSDPDDDQITVSDNTDPENGTLTIQPDGSFTYTPEDGFTGSDFFTYTVTDGHGGSSTAEVFINVGQSIALHSIIYGWEGHGLNLLLRGSTLEGEVTGYQLDVDNDGTFDYTASHDPDIHGALAFELNLLGLLGNPADDDSYPATVRVNTSGGNHRDFGVGITIGNTPPLIEFAEEAVIGDPGIPFVLPITTSDPGPDTVTEILVDWGDGTTTTIFGVSGAPTHVYATEGRYTIRATATDEDGSNWAEHTISIGDDPPPADTGEPKIISAVSIILENGNALLILEAENSSGSSADLTYEWDLDGDGVFETPGGPTIELEPGTDFYPYSAAVRIIDSQGRSTEALFGFLAPGNVMPGPATPEEGIRTFARNTGVLPAGTHFHHTKQLALAQRYWKERGINVFDPQYVRAIPESWVHLKHINSQQMKWWRKKATELGYGAHNWNQVFNDTRVTWTEIEDLETKLHGQFSKYWVPMGADQATISKAINTAREDKLLLGMTKASRAKTIGLIVAVPVILDLIGTSKALANVANFNPNDSDFQIFLDRYEDALVQTMGPAGRPSKTTAQHLVERMIIFAQKHTPPQHSDKVEAAKELLMAAIEREYGPFSQ
jgi:hypothetical protein